MLKALKSVSFAKTQSIKGQPFGIASSVASPSISAASRDGFKNSINPWSKTYRRTTRRRRKKTKGAIGTSQILRTTVIHLMK